MMKWTLLALAAGASGAYGACELTSSDESCSDVAPAGIYLEARDATVWGGACHISSEAESAGRRAALGWSFTDGRHAGVALAGTRVVAVVEGTCNLQGAEVFGTNETPVITSEVWIDAPSAAARSAALAYVQGATDLGEVHAVHASEVTLDYEADRFVMGVDGALRVSGESMADRSCCTMPESRWYSPLAEVNESVVGHPLECRFEGVDGVLDRWAFEGENSVFVASLGG
ncbi:MAG: hypothetical protein AAGG01_01010 [Planctomycetota bacterium]